MSIPNTRYNRYCGFLEKYRYFQEISAVSIPFDNAHVTAYLNIEGAFVPKTNIFSVCVCAVALCSKKCMYHRPVTYVVSVACL